MKNGKIKYEFSAKMWRHSETGGWYFISLPENFSKEIRENLQWQEEGWGRMKALAEIGLSKWETAIWYDTKQNRYLLPIKSEIRTKSKIKLNEEIKVNIWV